MVAYALNNQYLLKISCRNLYKLRCSLCSGLDARIEHVRPNIRILCRMLRVCSSSEVCRSAGGSKDQENDFSKNASIHLGLSRDYIVVIGFH